VKLPELEDLPDVAGRNVLVRCDFNVPLAEGRITDDSRIRAAVPTLGWLVERGAYVTACTHLGRPKGKPDPRFDVAPVRARLAELAPGVALLDNLRFEPGEEASDPAFVNRLVAGQDLYVDDAFGCVHRAHASIVGPPARLPSAAGRLLAREVQVLAGLLESPRRPFVAILGGAKVSDKLGVVSSLLDRVDTLLIGGAMCFTFLAAAGCSTGDSLVEAAHVDRCRELLASGRIVVPSDLVVASSEQPDQIAPAADAVPPGWKGMDIGPESSARFARFVQAAGTVLWNGPMGMFEDARFAAGTRAVAEAVASSFAFSVVGGGDTVAAVTQFGVTRCIDHVSTGGGATLEFVERGDLPGLKALRDSAARRRMRTGTELVATEV
jgi:phosphoglycerate kinase